MEWIRRGPDRGPGGFALPQQGSWISGRKAVFEVRLGSQFGDFICWELTSKEAVKQLAKLEARAFELQVLAGRTSQIDQRECAGSFSEALDAQHEFSARLLFDAGDPAHQVPPLVPGLQAESPISRFQQEIIGGDDERLFARFAQHRLGTSFEKALNGLLDLAHRIPYSKAGGFEEVAGLAAALP
jgi:hypothetical protein